MTNFESVRFWLLVNSYSGMTISTYLIENYKGKKLITVVKRLSKILSFNHKKLGKYVIEKLEPKYPYRRIPYKLKVYLEIENELVTMSEKKQDRYLTAREDYQNQLLLPAIERAAGNLLSDVKNDQRFNDKLEENIRIHRNIYYKVAYKYKLPTMRIVPFIIRLVT